jgi:hypothetical protein
MAVMKKIADFGHLWAMCARPKPKNTGIFDLQGGKTNMNPG